MAKKRRSRKRPRKKSAIPKALAVTSRQSRKRTARQAPSTNQANATPHQTVAQAQIDFAEEYRYVIADLERIGILAAAMFGLLVILAFIIH